ncbi:MAG TPA: class I SAM-dependent methyltransferase [Candidatus Cybelea sp.]|jgi:SAM-dependent methyltransferase
MAWGVWSIPEAELQILGDVAGKDMLELGCGGALWSIALTRRGAHCIGLDNSERQLDYARENQRKAGVEFPLIHGSAENVPLPDGSFDVVFCDHGAMSFLDPAISVPEASRLLRSGGMLAFSAETPLHFICWDDDTDSVGVTLKHNYFEERSAYDGSSLSFSVPYGEWIALFRRNGFEIESLVELRPPQNATTTFGAYVNFEWARSWPAEQIWRVRRT